MLYLVILLYFGILLLIGVLASRQVRDLSDYYVGGKRLNYWVVAFSARASGESAWLYLGLTGLGAVAGLQAMWVVAGEVLGVAVAWFVMARPFKEQTDKCDAITVPDYLVSRFRETPRMARLLRYVAACVLAVFVTIYVSAQIDATGTTFESFLHWDYYAGALFGFAVVVVYTLFGGFVAVAWSDLFQGLLMFFGLVLLPIAACWLLVSGGEWLAQLEALEPGMLSVWPQAEGGMLVSAIIGYLAIGIGFLGAPQVFVRFMSIKDDGEILAGRWVAIVFTLLTDAGAVLAGLFGRMLVAPNESSAALFGAEGLLGPGGQKILPVMVEAIFPEAIVGLYIAAVLAATMSTIDSLLVVASSAVTHDIYQRSWQPNVTAAQLTRLSRWVTLGLASVALSLSMAVAYFVPGRTIFWFVIFGWSGIAAAFCPVMVLSLFWKRYNAAGALASMCTGAVCVPLFKFVMPALPAWGPYFARLEELAPSFAVALIAGIVTTLATAPMGAAKPAAEVDIAGTQGEFT